MRLNSQPKISGFILDRDGVINVKANEISGSKYILHPDQLKLHSDFFEFAEWAGKSNKDLFVATNQQAIGLKELSFDTLEGIHQKIQHELQKKGLKVVRKFYVCGHLINTCKCRKPAPGLLQAILKDFELVESELVFVGDSPSDKSAADNIKMRFIQVRRNPDDLVFGNECVSNLRELIEMVD